MPSRGDVQFGRLAVENKFLREALLGSYLSKVDEERERGRRTTLERLLRQGGHLTSSQIQWIQEQQKRRIEFCPHCGRKHNVFGLDSGNLVRCDRCRETFEIVDSSPGATLKGKQEKNSPTPEISPAKTGSEAKPPPVEETDLDSVLFDLVGSVEPIRFPCARCGTMLVLEQDICSNCERIESSSTRI